MAGIDKGAKLTWVADNAARSYEYRYYYVTTDGVATAKTGTTTKVTVDLTGLTPKKGYTFPGAWGQSRGEWGVGAPPPHWTSQLFRLPLVVSS